MSEEVRLWKIGPADALHEIPRGRLDLEARIETWIEKDISILDPGLLVIGRQVQTEFSGAIDLLCLDATGDVVVVELKRHRTPREITAQVLDYGSWVRDLSAEQITAIAEAHLGKAKLEQVFSQRFRVELPDALNESHRLMIVASHIDPASERIIRYLSDEHGVSINAATFKYFKAADGSEVLARVFLLEPGQVEAKGKRSKRRPRLTREEWDAIAEENGVAELFEHAVSSLERWFNLQPKRVILSFLTGGNDGQKAVFNLLPLDSTAESGLCFQIYDERIARHFSITRQEVEALLPARREPWVYPTASDPGPDWEGFRGYFQDRAEIDALARGLARADEKRKASV